MRRTAVAWLTAGLALAVAQPAMGSVPVAGPPPQTGDAVPGEILVRFAPGTAAADRSAARAEAGALGTRRAALPDVQVLRVDPSRSEARVADRLAQRDDVVWAEPNLLYRATGLPDDPRLADQWGLANAGGWSRAIPATSSRRSRRWRASTSGRRRPGS
jgi:hypothetical protein